MRRNHVHAAAAPSSPVKAVNRGRLGAIGATSLIAITAASITVPAAASAASECTSSRPGGPVQVTAQCVDPDYDQPVIDSEQDVAGPVAHHRVSGHFEGTNIQFNIYLPPASQWKGRFFQYTYPTAFSPAENTAVAKDRAISFSLASGGYAVQAGNASLSLGYRHTAAAAKFAKTVAADYYHSGTRKIYGYLYGPSGGSYQTTGAAENTHGVWDGFVPTVQGVPMTGPYTFFIRAMARLVLADRANQISDAVRPGGSGDPYAGLNQTERQMLRELTDFGVPLRAWEDPDYLLGRSAADGLLGFGGIVRAIDPTYADDFWTKPGYLGTEQSPLGDLVRAALAGMGDTPDNRWDLALRTYYRHQLPAVGDRYENFDQFRNADGSPKYAQRPLLVGPLVFRGVSGGAAYNGQITAKMIVVDNLYDVDALPTYADWYAKRVKAALGDTAFGTSYRLYYNDHADHLEGPVTGAKASRIVSYDPIVEQALRDLSAWAEIGVTPPKSTRYGTEAGQVTVPSTAMSRRGIQPVVDLTVAGGKRVDVRVGQRVTFSAKAQVPPGTGFIVSTEWDFTGSGTYLLAPVGRPMPLMNTTGAYSYAEPGTYYVTVRVASSRTRDTQPFAQVQNLDRVRVVVHP